MGNASYWDGTSWVTEPVDSPWDSNAVMFVQPSAPTGAKLGDLHIDPTTSYQKYNNGAGWSNLKIPQVDVDGLVELLATYATTGSLALKADIVSPTFTGTVGGITKSMVGLANVDDTTDIDKPVSTATQTALNLKVDTSALNKSAVGLGNVDNTTDLLKPVSTATQTALNLKANLASPTFTGTVGGITKSMVGLGNVDNTTDLLKPLSTAAIAEFATKANLASPAFTGTVSGITAAMVGASATGHTHVKANITDFAHTHAPTDISGLTATVAELNYMDGVTSNVQTQINGKAATSHTHTKADITDFEHTHLTSDLSDTSVTATQLDYVVGVTSPIQTQINGKQDSGSYAAESHTHTVSQITDLSNYGTNSDGSYVRLPDGTQICWHRFSITPSANNPTGKTWTFPAAFTEEPTVNVTANTTVPMDSVKMVSAAAGSATSVTIYIYRINTKDTEMNLTAVGRWY